MSVVLEEPPQAAHLLSEVSDEPAPTAIVDQALEEVLNALNKVEPPAHEHVQQEEGAAVDASAQETTSEEVATDATAVVPNDPIEDKGATEPVVDVHEEADNVAEDVADDKSELYVPISSEIAAEEPAEDVVPQEPSPVVMAAALPEEANEVTESAVSAGELAEEPVPASEPDAAVAEAEAPAEEAEPVSELAPEESGAQVAAPAVEDAPAPEEVAVAPEAPTADQMTVPKETHVVADEVVAPAEAEDVPTVAEEVVEEDAPAPVVEEDVVVQDALVVEEASVVQDEPSSITEELPIVEEVSAPVAAETMVAETPMPVPEEPAVIEEAIVPVAQEVAEAEAAPAFQELAPTPEAAVEDKDETHAPVEQPQETPAIVEEVSAPVEEQEPATVDPASVPVEATPATVEEVPAPTEQPPAIEEVPAVERSDVVEEVEVVHEDIPAPADEPEEEAVPVVEATKEEPATEELPVVEETTAPIVVEATTEEPATEELPIVEETTAPIVVEELGVEAAVPEEVAEEISVSEDVPAETAPETPTAEETPAPVAYDASVPEPGPVPEEPVAEEAPAAAEVEVDVPAVEDSPTPAVEGAVIENVEPEAAPVDEVIAPEETPVEVVEEAPAAVEPEAEVLAVEDSPEPAIEDAVIENVQPESVPVVVETASEPIVEEIAQSIPIEALKEETASEDVVPTASAGDVVISEDTPAVEEVVLGAPAAEIEAPVVDDVIVVETVQEAEETSDAVEQAPVVEEAPVEPEIVVSTEKVVEETPAQATEPIEETLAAVEIPVVAIDTVKDEPEEAEAAVEPAAISRSPSPSPSLQDRPKSPWTPSYSVTTQGPGITAAEEETEIAELEQLPPATEEAAAAPPPQVEITAEPEDEATAESAVPEESDVPKSPSWVPSYSVSSQGASPHHSPKALAEETAEEPVLTLAAKPELEPAPVVGAIAPTEVIPESVEVYDAAPEVVEVPEVDSETVVSQGTFIVEEAVEEAPVTEVPTIATEDVEAVELHEAPKAPWVPSYSVSSQGSTPLHIPQQTAEDVDVKEIESLPSLISVEDVTPAEPEVASVPEPEVDQATAIVETHPAIEVPVVEVSEPVAEVSEPVVQASASIAYAEETSVPVIVTEALVEAVPEPKTPQTVPADRPKSPWTPSYSVTYQGNSPLGTPAVQTKELEEVEELPLLIHEEQPSIVVEESAPLVTEAEQPAQTSTLEESLARPWTPSYSVTRQGPASDVGADEEPAASAEKPVLAVATNGNGSGVSFPATGEELKKVDTKPSLGRLAVVDENEQIQIDQSETSAPAELSPSAARTRLESTTSSRFFPGGWFSSTTKLPEEGRTSLEIATAVFAKNNGDSPVASPAVEAPPATPVDGNVDGKNKGKWCVIM